MGRGHFAAGFLRDESLRREFEGRALNIVLAELIQLPNGGNCGIMVFDQVKTERQIL